MLITVFLILIVRAKESGLLENSEMENLSSLCSLCCTIFERATCTIQTVGLSKLIPLNVWHFYSFYTF